MKQIFILGSLGGFMSVDRILIVEDEKLFAQLLSDALSDQENVEVSMASNGKIALQMFEDTEFNLVLTDIHMPEMNGREFLKNLRGLNNHVGIIVLTAFPQADYIKQFNDLEIVEFLSKDECDLIGLQTLVSSYLHKQKVEFLSEGLYGLEGDEEF